MQIQKLYKLLCASPTESGKPNFIYVSIQQEHRRCETSSSLRYTYKQCSAECARVLNATVVCSPHQT